MKKQRLRSVLTPLLGGSTKALCLLSMLSLVSVVFVSLPMGGGAHAYRILGALMTPGALVLYLHARGVGRDGGLGSWVAACVGTQVFLWVAL